MPSTEENPRKTQLVAARERGKLMIAYNEIKWCFAGPGPARYKLPALLGFRQHDVTKMVMPAHTIGKKLCSSEFKKHLKRTEQNIGVFKFLHVAIYYVAGILVVWNISGKCLKNIITFHRC